MARKAEKPVELDLDEDLFGFDEVMPEEGEEADHEIDLDEIFAAFEEQEPQAPASEEASDPDQDALDELFGSVEPRAAAPEPAAKPEPAPAPAPANELQAAPEPAPAPAPAPAQRKTRLVAPAAAARPQASGRGAAFLTRSAAAVLIAMTLLNVSIALVTFSSANGMKDELATASREMAAAADEIRVKVDQQTLAVHERFAPIVPLERGEHPTLDLAAQDLESGRFAEARRRVYALLAVADRLPEASREDLEARAAFLIARSYHAEALAAREQR